MNVTEAIRAVKEFASGRAYGADLLTRAFATRSILLTIVSRWEDCELDIDELSYYSTATLILEQALVVSRSLPITFFQDTKDAFEDDLETYLDTLFLTSELKVVYDAFMRASHKAMLRGEY